MTTKPNSNSGTPFKTLPLAIGRAFVFTTVAVALLRLPSSAWANGTALYFDVNGTTAGFGSPAGSYNLNGAYWSASSAGTAATAAWTSGGQMTFGNTSSDFAGGAFTINCNVSTSWSGLLVNSGSANVTLNGTGNINLTGTQTWTVPGGATFNENVTFNTGQMLNANNASVSLQGAGTINFQTMIGYNSTSSTITEAMTNGTVNFFNAYNPAVAGVTAQASYTLLAGTLNFASAASANAFNGLLAGKSFTIAGGTIDNTSGSAMALGLGAGFYNMVSNFTFNGSSSLDFGPANVNEGTNTLVITVSNNTLTISGSITNIHGGTAKAGPGSLALAGTDTYTNATLVTGGSLVLTGSGSVNNSSGITVNGTGAELVQNSGTPGTMPVTLTLGTLDGTAQLGNVTVANNSTNVVTAGYGGTGTLAINNLTFNGAAAVNGVNGATIAVANMLSTGPGSITVNASSYGGWGVNGGTTTLLTYGSLGGNGTNGFVLGTIAGISPRQSGSLAFLPGAVGVQVLGGDIPIWTGAQNNKWTTNAVGGLQNWRLQIAGTNTEFLNGDYVVFDDTVVGSTNVVISDANVLPNNATFNNNSVNYLVSGGFGIAGGGSVTLAGGGTVTLATSNTYSGGTTINSGILQLGDGVANNGSVRGNILDNGALVFANPAVQSYSGLISGNGPVTKIGGGLLVLSGANSYLGQTTLGAGTLSLANGSAVSSGTLDIVGSSTLQWNGITTDLSAQMRIEDGVTLTLDTMNKTVTLGSPLTFGGIAGAGLTKVGSGTLIIGPSSDNFYTGNTTIKAGTLVAGNANGLTGIGDETTVFLGDTSSSSNATLQLGSNTSSSYVNNLIVQSGNTGLMILNGLGNITNSGTITLGSTGGSGKSLTIANTGTTANTFHLSGVIQDPTGLTTGTAGAVTVGTTSSGGQVTFDAANAYTSNTRVAYATLGLNNPAALQNSTLDMNAADSGTVSFVTTGMYTLGGLQGARNLALGANMVNVGNNNQSTLYSGAMSGVGGLTKIGAGTLTLSGTNTYTGNTTVSAGTLALTNTGTIGGCTNINVAAGAWLDVSALSSTFTLGNSQILSGSGAVTGSVATVSGSAIAAGAAGTAATLAFANSLNLGAGGNVDLNLSTSAASGNSQITVAGNLTLSSSDIIYITELGAGNLDTTADYILFSVAGTTTMTSTPLLIFTTPQPANAGHYTLALNGNNLVMHYNSVSGPVVVASVSPNPALRNQPVTISATVTPGSASVASVTVDLSGVGGSSTTPLTTSDNNNYSCSYVIPASVLPESLNLRVTVTDTTTPTPLQGYCIIPGFVVNASTEVWDGNAVDENFSSNNNWVSGYAPGWTGDSLDFGGSTGLTPNLDLAYTVNGLVFDTTASTFTIGSSGGTLTLAGTGTGVTNTSGNLQTLNVPVALSSPQTFNTANGDIVLSGLVSGTNALTKLGTNNTLWLNASNSYTGGTFITGGMISISNALALGSSGTIDFNGNATLQWNNGVNKDLSSRLQINDGVSATLDTTTNNVTLASPFSWGPLRSGSLTKAGTGVLTLTATNGCNGSATVAGGTLTLKGPTGFTNQNLMVSSVSGVNGVAIISTNATMNSLVIGTNAGTFGAVYVTGGTVLRTGKNDVIGVDGYGYLNLSGGTLIGDAMWDGSQSGTHPNGVGVITQTGGTFSQTNGQPFVLGGINTVGGIGVFNITGGNLNVTGSGSAYLTSCWDTSTSSGRGEFNFSGGSATASEFYFKGQGTGVLNLLGGSLAVSNVATLTTYNNPSAIGYVNFNGGTLQASAPGALINLATPGTMNNVFIFSGGATINTGTNTVSIVNPLNVPSASGVSGIALVNGGVGYIGEPYVQLTSNDSGVGATARAQINVASGIVTNIVITCPGTGYSVAPSVSLLGGGATTPATLGTVSLANNVGGGLTKTGTAALTLLSAGNTYTGSTVVSNGNLEIAGQIGGTGVTVVTNAALSGAGTINANIAVLQGGIIAPGTNSVGTNTVGTLTVIGNVTSAGGFVIQINKSLAQSNSVLAVSGSLTQTGPGVLTVTNVGPALAVGDTFQLFNGAALSGGSALIISPAPGAGLAWTNQLAVNGSIAVYSPLPSTPTNLTATVSGGQLSLSWPPNYTGWLLQSNSVNLAVTNDWVTVPGSASTNALLILIDPTKTNVFYRMAHP